MSVNHGSKRITTGAHYGLRDWLAQRITAALMASFTLLVLVQVIFTSGPIGYEEWAGIFAAQWMKVLTFVTILSLLYHAWIGIRDMDGLHQTPRFASFLACCLPDMAHRLRWLGCSGLVASLMMFGTD